MPPRALHQGQEGGEPPPRPRLPSIRPLLEQYRPTGPPPPPRAGSSSLPRPLSAGPAPPSYPYTYAQSVRLAAHPALPPARSSPLSAPPPPLAPFPPPPPRPPASPAPFVFPPQPQTLFYAQRHPYAYGQHPPQQSSPGASLARPPPPPHATAPAATGARVALISQAAVTPLTSLQGRSGSAVAAGKPRRPSTSRGLLSPPAPPPPRLSTSASSVPPRPAPTPLSPTSPPPSTAPIAPSPLPLPKTHRCASCPLAFARRNDLVRHERVHTGEMPFGCARCGMRFRRSDARRRHELKDSC